MLCLYIGGLINLGEEVYYYKAEIRFPINMSPQLKNNCKTVRTVDKTCGKHTFSWFHIRVELKLARISKLQLVPFVCLNFSCPLYFFIISMCRTGQDTKRYDTIKRSNPNALYS